MYVHALAYLSKVHIFLNSAATDPDARLVRESDTHSMRYCLKGGLGRETFVPHDNNTDKPSYKVSLSELIKYIITLCILCVCVCNTGTMTVLQTCIISGHTDR